MDRRIQEFTSHLQSPCHKSLLHPPVHPLQSHKHPLSQKKQTNSPRVPSSNPATLLPPNTNTPRTPTPPRTLFPPPNNTNQPELPRHTQVDYLPHLQLSQRHHLLCRLSHPLLLRYKQTLSICRPHLPVCLNIGLQGRRPRLCHLMDHLSHRRSLPCMPRDRTGLHTLHRRNRWICRMIPGIWAQRANYSTWMMRRIYTENDHGIKMGKSLRGGPTRAIIVLYSSSSTSAFSWSWM